MLPGWAGVMVPSKLFGVLAASRPVLFIGPEESEVSRVIEELDCGSTIDPGDIDELVARIRELAKNPIAARQAGLRGRDGLLREHDAPHRLEAWRTLLERVAGPARGAT